MAYKTIGQLDAAASAESADLIEIEQSGVSKHASIDQILNNEGRLMSASGIKFPAAQVPSADANTLDDYEEGTWTPVITGSTTAGTYELTAGNATYTKIGRVVHLEALIILASSITAGGSGNTQITGLPFTKMTNSNTTGSIAMSGVDWTAGANLSLIFSTSGPSSTLQIQETKDNAAYGGMPISGLVASDVIHIAVTYFV